MGTPKLVELVVCDGWHWAGGWRALAICGGAQKTQQARSPMVGGTSGAPGHPRSWRAQLRTHVHQQWTGCTRCRCAAARASESASVTLGQLACWASVCAEVLSKEVLRLQQTRTASGRAVGGWHVQGSASCVRRPVVGSGKQDGGPIISHLQH